MSTLKVFDGSQWVTVAAPADTPDVPTGGATGQVLAKKSNTDFDLQWAEPSDPVYVGPNPPPGTPAVGDEWFDSDEDGKLGTTLPLTVGNGGTGASSAAAARTNLGIILPLGLADGGTGGTTAATARASLAVPAVGQSGSTAGPPTSGTWARGDYWIDSLAALWTCSTAGTPGTWTCQTVARFATAAARTSAISAPVLNQLTMLDSRPGITQYWSGSAWVDQIPFIQSGWPSITFDSGGAGVYTFPYPFASAPGLSVAHQSTGMGTQIAIAINTISATGFTVFASQGTTGIVSGARTVHFMAVGYKP